MCARAAEIDSLTPWANDSSRGHLLSGVFSMNPHPLHIWNGWDVVAVLWLVVGLSILALVPTALTLTGDARAFLLVVLFCSGPFFLLAAFGRRGQHITHFQEHPRPFDAPD